MKIGKKLIAVILTTAMTIGTMNLPAYAQILHLGKAKIFNG